MYRDIAEFFKALIFVVAITGISMECFKLIDLACNLLIANTKPLMQDVNQRTHYTICLLVFSSKLKMLDGWYSAHKTLTATGTFCLIYTYAFVVISMSLKPCLGIRVG